jgi:pantoate--beta-alanine ligase
MYPAGFGTTVDPGPVADGLCGRNRPGHFTGVATVVARLFGIVAPDVAYFGLKDYQQVAVIRRVVADLALPVEIRGIPTVREPDGLAMSSRNAYLSPEERAAAPALFQALQAAGAGFASGERRAEHLLDLARRRLEDAGMEVEYLELRDAETLGEYTPERGAVLAAAVHLGGTRLIDNVLLTPPRLPGLRGPTLATGKVTP